MLVVYSSLIFLPMQGFLLHFHFRLNTFSKMWGGKRKGAGRAKFKEGRDWNKYKKDGKRRKLQEATKNSMNLKSFCLRKETCPSNENVDSDASHSKAELESDLEDIDIEVNEYDGKNEAFKNADNNNCNETVGQGLQDIDNNQSMWNLDVPALLPFFVNGCRVRGI